MSFTRDWKPRTRNSLPLSLNTGFDRYRVGALAMSAPEHWYHGTPASRAERVARAIQQAKWVEADLSPERFPTLGQLHLNYCRVLASSVLAALAPEMAVVALSSAMARHWSEWMPGKEWADQERAIKVRLVSAATALDYEEKP